MYRNVPNTLEIVNNFQKKILKIEWFDSDGNSLKDRYGIAELQYGHSLTCTEAEARHQVRITLE